MFNMDDNGTQHVGARFSVSEVERLAATARQMGTTSSEILREASKQYVDAATAGVVRTAKEYAYVQEPCPYTFDQRGPSLIRDWWDVRTGGALDRDSEDRIRRFQRWQDDPRVRAEATQLALAANVDARFTETTSNASNLIPPGYLANFLPPTVARPLYDAAAKRPLVGSHPATPFSLPGRAGAVTSAGAGGRPFQVSGAAVTGSGAVAAHAEGAATTEGDLTVPTPITVSPQGKTGLYKLTRELLDASNPQADEIALSVMREEYARQCEAILYGELNGANGQGGTLTGTPTRSGSGAWVSSGVTAANLPTEVKGLVARLPFRHPAQQQARAVVANEPATVALADLDTTERWMQGVNVAAAPAMTGQATTDGAAFVLADNDLWAWESPLLTFRFDEKSGPALIELAVYGYFAARLLRPAGLQAVRMA